MLLAIDVGNTNIVLGLFRGDNLIESFRLNTSTERTRDEFGMAFISLFNLRKINIEEIDGVIISSVVPPLMYSLERAVKKYIGVTPIVASPALFDFMVIKYENRADIGADRLVNALAGYRAYGGPLILIDFGTATTFCAIDEDGAYLGGVICPGIKISGEALFSRTAKLPRVEIVKPSKVVGTSTAECMQAGIYYGYTGLVDNIVRNIKKQMEWTNCKVVALGGLASLIFEESTTIDELNGALTLNGLKLLYDIATT